MVNPAIESDGLICRAGDKDVILPGDAGDSLRVVIDRLYELKRLTVGPILLLILAINLIRVKFIDNAMSVILCCHNMGEAFGAILWKDLILSTPSWTHWVAAK